MGGFSNSACTNSFTTIAGGCANTATGVNSAILGGSNNIANQNYAGVYGCGITTSMACAWHVNRLVIANVPLSSAGLPSGAVWSNAGVLNIVP